MSTTPLQSTEIPGFTVVPKRQLGEYFHGSQSAFYVLLGRHGDPHAPRESVVFVDYLDDFLAACQQQIEDFWAKHRIMVTHVAVKLEEPHSAAEPNLTQAYERALAVQELRHRLQPRFRRV